MDKRQADPAIGKPIDEHQEIGSATPSRLRAIIHQAQSTVSRSEVERLAEAMETEEGGAGAGKKKCQEFCPPSFSGHWRDWHRGHGCHLDPGQPPIESAPPSSLSSCARSEAQRIRELKTLSDAANADMPVLATERVYAAAVQARDKARIALAVRCRKDISWLLQRSEEAREDRKTAVEAMRQLKVTEEALVASRQECQELSAAVTTSDLDHASVVLVARANAQDSEIVEAVKASAEEARETIKARDEEIKAVFAAALKQIDVANALQDELAAARQDAERLRAALTELKNAADDSLRTTGQRAGVPMFVPSVAKRVLAIVGPPLAASGSQGEGDCLAPLMPLPEAAARLRATPQEHDDALTRSGMVDVEPPPQPAATDTER